METPREGMPDKVGVLIDGIDAVLADMGVSPPEPISPGDVYRGPAAGARRILGTQRLSVQAREAMGLPAPRSKAHGEVEIVRENEL